jgi:hypothetical protein
MFDIHKNCFMDEKLYINIITTDIFKSTSENISLINGNVWWTQWQLYVLPNTHNDH